MCKITDKIKVQINPKSRYFKTDKNIQRYINNGLKKLYFQIQKIEESGTPFEKIFNNDDLIYDKIGNYFTFKHHDADNTQLRILYSYEKTKNGERNLKLIHFSIKRNNNKEYIKFFTDYIKSFNETQCDFKTIEI